MRSRCSRSATSETVSVGCVAIARVCEPSGRRPEGFFVALLERCREVGGKLLLRVLRLYLAHDIASAGRRLLEMGYLLRDITRRDTFNLRNRRVGRA